MSAPAIEDLVRVEIGLLGPIVLRHADTESPVAAPLHRRLLARLAVEPGEPVSIDRLVDAMWGEQPPASAERMVPVHVGRVRRLLEPARSAGEPWSVLVTDPAGYRLSLDHVLVDVVEFERDVEQARELIAAGAPERGIERLSGALARWRGPAFADVAGVGFVAPSVARLDAVRRDAIEQLAELQLKVGQPGLALARVSQLLAQEPLREHALALEARALAALGDPDDARRVLDDARRRLDEVVGIEPGPVLRDALVTEPDLDAGHARGQDEGVEATLPVSEDVVALVDRCLADGDPGRGVDVARILAAAERSGCDESEVLDELVRRVDSRELERVVDSDGRVRVRAAVRDR